MPKVFRGPACTESAHVKEAWRAPGEGSSSLEDVEPSDPSSDSGSDNAGHRRTGTESKGRCGVIVANPAWPGCPLIRPYVLGEKCTGDPPPKCVSKVAAPADVTASVSQVEQDLRLSDDDVQIVEVPSTSSLPWEGEGQ